jgi:putative transposase
MARRNVIFQTDNYYHIYNRGNNYQDIFLEKENYRYFVKRYHDYFDPTNVDLIAYCLMPNHFHLLIHLQTDTDVSNIMRQFSNSYTKAFNNWHGQTGHLFQGPFRAKQIEQEGYLPYLCAYIHLNPVKANLVLAPEHWNYSDYKEWILPKNNKMTIRKEILQEYFGSIEGYKIFVSALAEEQKIKKEFEQMMID